MQAQKNINQNILELMEKVNREEKARVLKLTKQVYSPVKIIPADEHNSNL